MNFYLNIWQELRTVFGYRKTFVQCVLHGPVASTASGSLLEMQNFKPHPSTMEPKSELSQNVMICMDYIFGRNLVIEDLGPTTLQVDDLRYVQKL